MSFTVPKGRGQGPARREDARKTAGHQASTATGCSAGQACGEQSVQHPPPLPPNIAPPYSRDNEMPRPPPSSCVWGTVTLAEKYSWTLRGCMVMGTPPQPATRTFCLGITHQRNSGTQPVAEPGLVSVAIGCSGSSTEDSRAQATVFLLPDSSISAPNTHTHVHTQSRTLTLSFTYTPTLTYLCANTCTHTHAQMHMHSFMSHSHTLTYRHTS